MAPRPTTTTDSIQATITALLAGTALPHVPQPYQTALAKYLATYHGATLEGPAIVTALETLVHSWTLVRVDALRRTRPQQGDRDAARS